MTRSRSGEMGRRWARLCGLVVLAAWAGGCGGPGAPGGGALAPAVAGGGAARFTILLAQYDGPDGLPQAQAMQQRARGVLGGSDVWVSREAEGVTVNYGHFDRNTPGSTAQRELARVRGVYGRLGAGPYQFCYVKELPEPEPQAPAEWNLLNAKCAYSLEVATFFNVPEREVYGRKASAVQAVANLRKEGQTAFFVHGRNESRVYVGCFPAHLVQATQPGGPAMVSPLVEVLRKKYPYHENGQKIVMLQRRPDGKTERVERASDLVQVEYLRKEVPY